MLCSFASAKVTFSLRLWLLAYSARKYPREMVMVTTIHVRPEAIGSTRVSLDQRTHLAVVTGAVHAAKPLKRLGRQ